MGTLTMEKNSVSNDEDFYWLSEHKYQKETKDFKYLLLAGMK